MRTLEARWCLGQVGLAPGLGMVVCARCIHTALYPSSPVAPTSLPLAFGAPATVHRPSNANNYPPRLNFAGMLASTIDMRSISACRSASSSSASCFAKCAASSGWFSSSMLVASAWYLLRTSAARRHSSQNPPRGVKLTFRNGESHTPTPRRRDVPGPAASHITSAPASCLRIRITLQTHPEIRQRPPRLHTPHIFLPRHPPIPIPIKKPQHPLHHLIPPPRLHDARRPLLLALSCAVGGRFVGDAVGA